MDLTSVYFLVTCQVNVILLASILVLTLTATLGSYNDKKVFVPSITLVLLCTILLGASGYKVLSCQDKKNLKSVTCAVNPYTVQGQKNWDAAVPFMVTPNE